MVPGRLPPKIGLAKFVSRIAATLQVQYLLGLHKLGPRGETRHMRVTLLSLAAAMLCLATGANAYHSESGRISGRVMDSLRQPMPGVVVLARRTSEGIAARTETIRDGRYAFASLPSGEYSLDFDLLGFDIERRNEVPTSASPNAADVDV